MRQGRILEQWCPWRTPECAGHSDRNPDDVVAVVVHYTGAGPMSGTARWLCSPGCPVSYHVMIERDGSACQFVDLNRKAWHAGRGELDGSVRVNSMTIGVALCNHGPLEADDVGQIFAPIGDKLVPYRGERPMLAEHHGVSSLWEPYDDRQLATLARLLTWFERSGWPRRVVGHDFIARPQGRKLDPWPLFPWSDFTR